MLRFYAKKFHILFSRASKKEKGMETEPLFQSRSFVADWRYAERLKKVLLTFQNISRSIQEQGCQMVYFQTKNTNLGKFWRALEWKRLVYSMAIWNVV
jgi:hypothetical protein